MNTWNRNEKEKGTKFKNNIYIFLTIVQNRVPKKIRHKRR